jgi:hypothetical protein
MPVAKALNANAMACPEAVARFVECARRQTDYELR